MSSAMAESDTVVRSLLADLKLHPEQLEQKDASGLLPLHRAANGTRWKEGDDTALSDQDRVVCVKEMLRLYPDAASIGGGEAGQMPLQFAVESSAPA